MRKKIMAILNKIYGVLMTASFFGGVLPLIPFIACLCIGGPIAEKISVFLYNDYYPWVIIAGSIAIVIGIISMYIGKIEDLSVKSVAKNTEKKENK